MTSIREKSRQQLLAAPLDLLPVSSGSKKKLTAMGYSTVMEVFRAALTGRLSSRNKNGASFEKAVLNAGCTMLGHPVIDHDFLRSYRPVDDRETVADALRELNGRPFKLSRSTLASSIRELLLPMPLNDSVMTCGINTIADFLSSTTQGLIAAQGIGVKNLGRLLVYAFDYLFIINEPELGLPPVVRTPASFPAPELFDIRTKLLLNPWFTTAELKAGFALRRKNPLNHVIMFRKGAGALLCEGKYAQVMGQFDAAPHIPQGFKIEAALCGYCGRPRKFCRHVAALAMELLERSAGDKEETELPAPLAFNASPWQTIGRFMFDVFGPGAPGCVTASRAGEVWRLAAHAQNGAQLSMLVDEETALEGQELFDDRFNRLDDCGSKCAAPGELIELFCRLTMMNRSNAEVELNEFGKQSIGQKRDKSIWLWAAGKMFLAGARRFIVRRDAKGGQFVLTARSAGEGREIFKLRSPRDRTPELLTGLAKFGIVDPPLPPAMAFSRVYYEENGSLLVSPALRFADGTIMARNDLEADRFGRYYWRAEGLLPVREQDDRLRIGENLFVTTRIAPNDVPEFLKRNRQALLAEENEVDPALTGFGLRDLPDNLSLSSCRMEDDWCYLAGHYGLGNRNISLAELFETRMKGLEYLPAKGEWLKLKGGPLEWFHNLTGDRLWSEKGAIKGVRLSRRELLSLAAVFPGIKIEGPRGEKAALRKLLDEECWQDEKALPAVPPHLRGYQRNGLAWLYHLYKNRLGGILADDMGLGKTHQALGLLAAVLKDGGGGKRFLVVCPATVVSHWIEKLKRFYPEIGYYVYHGINRNLNDADESTLFFTTYGIVRRDVEELRRLDFDIIFFDEIQKVKNKKTGAYNAAARLNARVVIGLTGTPLENSVYDLKAIFDICLPAVLGADSGFKKCYAVPIEEYEDRGKRDTLARLLHPFMLRRTRQQVLSELPDVIEDIRTCELSADQVRLYREVIAGRGRPLLDRLSEDKPDGRLPYMEILAVINYLKQICNHPSLVEHCDDPHRYASGKWDLFIELLEECLSSSMKVVIFSQYTRMLDLIARYLDEAGIAYCGLRGNMNLKKRGAMIDRFNQDETCRVFCASLLAGGVGIDLTAAQAVIHFDRWWNASREDQATARVHRMGQKHVVQVFKLVTTGTLEEKIHRMIDKKRDLSRQLVREDDASVIKRLSREELMELLQWRITAGAGERMTDN